MDFISADHCRQIIDIHFKLYASAKQQEDKKFVEFQLRPFQEENGTKTGHLGEYFRLTIKLQSGKSLGFFVKRILSAPNRPDFLKLVTRKEMCFYNWLHSTPEATDATCAASCLPKYYLSTETFIVLELLDYQPVSRESTDDRNGGGKFDLCYDYLKCAVEELAKFHALVAFVESQTPIQSEMVTEAMLTTTIYMDAITRGVKKYLEHLKDLQFYFDVQVQQMLRVFNPSPINFIQFKVLCHGDLWSNNLLFANVTNNECKLIDFQLIRHAEPAHDLCTLLVHNSSMEYKHFGELTDHYYEKLVEASSKHHLDIQAAFPKMEFDASIEAHATAALITKIIYAGFAAATQLRKLRQLNIPLDELMAQNNYNFLADVCAIDTQQKLIFDGLIDSLAKHRQSVWVTEDIVRRLIHRTQTNNNTKVLNFKFSRNLRNSLKIDVSSRGENEKEQIQQLVYTVKTPNSFYEHFNCTKTIKIDLKSLQKCYLYLKRDLMILESLDDEYELQNSRVPFGLDDVKSCLSALAEFHAFSYLESDETHKFPQQNWSDYVYKLRELFKVEHLNINYASLVEKLQPTINSINTMCVQHTAYNHEHIYFQKSKFDLERIQDNSMPLCRIALAENEMLKGSPCEEVLAFLFCTTTKSFRTYNSEEVLNHYYNSFTTLLLRNETSIPFSLLEFQAMCKSFQGLAIIDALLYHQRALIEEKQRIHKVIHEIVWENEERVLAQNYQHDPILRERLDELIHDFCDFFQDCIITT